MDTSRIPEVGIPESMVKQAAIDLHDKFQLHEVWDTLRYYLTAAYELGRTDQKSLTKRPKKRILKKAQR